MKKIENRKLFILQSGFFIVIIVMFLPIIRSAGTVLFAEDESRVWGLTYQLLGMDWSAYMEPDSLISFGYSLLLTPLCALLGRSGAVYKIVVMGNMAALCGSYLLSLYVSYNVFKGTNKVRLTLACGFIALCPGLAVIKAIAVPDLLLLLIFWMALALLVRVYQKPGFTNLLLFGAVLGLGVWFHAMMLCVMIAGTAAIIFFVLEKKIRERDALLVILFMIVLVGIGQIVEHFMVSQIILSDGQRASTGINSLIMGLKSGWEKSGFWASLQSGFGKLYGLCISMLLTVIPGFYAIRRYRNRINAIGVFSVVSVLLVWMALSVYYADSTKLDLVVNARMLIIVAGPLAILGIVDFFQSPKWQKHLGVYVVTMAILTFSVSFLLKSFPIPEEISYNSSIFLKGLENIMDTAGNLIYLIAAIVILVIVSLGMTARCEYKKKQSRFLFRTLGTCCLFGVSVAASITMINSDVIAQNTRILQNQNKILQALTGQSEQTQYPIYYLKTNDNQKSATIQLQYLMQRQQIRTVDLSNTQVSQDQEEVQEEYALTREEGNYYFLADAHSPRLLDFQKSFRLLELTDDYALFTSKNSECEKAAAQNQAQYINVLPVNGSEKVNLPSGTYECMITADIKGEDLDTLGSVSLLVDGKKLQQTQWNRQDKEEHVAVAHFNFSSARVLKDITIELVKNKDEKVVLKDVVYRKTSPLFTVGEDSPENIETIFKTIRSLDDKTADYGTIAVVNDSSVGDQYNAIDYIQTSLPDNQVTGMKQGDEADADYLIGLTDSRSFFDYMNDYTIIEMNKKYVLMIKSGNVREKSLEAIGKMKLSDGRRLVIEGFLTQKKGSYHYEEPIGLMSGNFDYVVEVQRTPQSQNWQEGSIVLMNRGEIVAEQAVSNEDFDDTGKAIIKIPLNLPSEVKDLSFEVTGDSLKQAAVKPVYLEMKSAKFMAGSDNEEGISKFTDIIEKAGKGSEIYYITSPKVKETGIFSLELLESKLPECVVTNRTQSEVKYIGTDVFLILQNFSMNYAPLTERFTMVCQEGRYSLWVASKSRLLTQVTQNGISTLITGADIPVNTLKIDSDLEANEVGPLSKGSYQLTAEAWIEDDSRKTNAVVQVIGFKSEAAIKTEIDEIMQQQVDEGIITEEQMEDTKLRREIRNSLETYLFIDEFKIDSTTFLRGDSKIFTMDLQLEYPMDKIKLEYLNKDASDVKVQLQYIKKY